MNDTIEVLIAMSLSASIIAIILFTATPIIKKHFSKAWLYYIWLIVILRLLVPYTPQVNVMNSVYSDIEELAITEDIKNTILNEDDRILPYDKLQNTNEIASKTVVSDVVLFIYNHLFLIWFMIMLILLIQKVTCYRSFIGYVKSGRELVRDRDTLILFSKVCKEVGIKVQPQLYTNKVISSPMLIGVFKPFIIIPEAQIPEEHLQYIFLHELMHQKKFDIIYKWLMQLALCVHWFNPIVHLIAKEINKICEFACDESLLALQDEKNKKAYGDTLIYSLEIAGAYNDQIISMNLSQDGQLLKDRLIAINKFTSRTQSNSLISIILACVCIMSSLWIGVYPMNAAVQEGDQSYQELITRNDVNRCALEIMQRTGNWRYVEPLFKHMTSKGVEDVVSLYIQKTGNYNRTRTAARYMDNTKRGINFEGSQSINKTYEALAYELIDETEDIYSSIAIFEFMDESQVDQLVIEYISKTKEIRKVYEVYEYMSTDAIDKVVIDYMTHTEDEESIVGLMPFMSDSSMEKISKWMKEVNQYEE
ncbi:M56 family metallopeptidase [Vallitalea okinawensis]|uniref:M56 family metallopeptidase n=1 Tax=Vallitalea okinawensis TaxID=2078660 RepID=UPI001300190E|nr:M56 family metallopeptidase [Vallitalea okinawensis]